MTFYFVKLIGPGKHMKISADGSKSLQNVAILYITWIFPPTKNTKNKVQRYASKEIVQTKQFRRVYEVKFCPNFLLHHSNVCSI